MTVSYEDEFARDVIARQAAEHDRRRTHGPDRVDEDGCAWIANGAVRANMRRRLFDVRVIIGDLWMSPSEARILARALTSAAEWAEGPDRATG